MAQMKIGDLDYGYEILCKEADDIVIVDFSLGAGINYFDNISMTLFGGRSESFENDDIFLDSREGTYFQHRILSVTASNFPFWVEETGKYCCAVAGYCKK